MAHAHTELRLSDGLNVLVGPNNIGKSSIAVALKILARNANSSFVMQHDQKECSILVETSEGNVIQWIKRKGPSYTINGQIKDRLGRGGTPPELDTTLRLAAVEFEDKEFEPHFGDQKSPIFLINRPASQIAQFFSTTSDAERLVAMQRLHQKNRADAVSHSKWLCDENTRIENDLKCLQEVAPLGEQLEQLEAERSKINKLTIDIVGLQEFIQQLAWLSLDHLVEQQRMSCLSGLLPAPFQHSTDFLESTIQQVDQLQFQSDFLSISKSALSELLVPPKLERTEVIESLLQDLVKASSELEYVYMVMSTCNNLTPPPELIAIDLIVHSISETSKTFSDYRWSSDLISELQFLEKPLEFIELGPVKTSISAMQNLFDVEQQNSELVHELESEMKHLEREADLWLQSQPVCSQCGAVLSMDSVRWKSHRHPHIPSPTMTSAKKRRRNTQVGSVEKKIDERALGEDLE